MPILEVNGVNLYYELLGQPGAPVLVLNNGVIMNAATSWGFQRPLAERYRLLLYDCRGQGASDHPDQPYSMELHAADLAALLAALSIPAAHIGGISYGGEVAQAFALRYPQMTRSLILADTVSEVGPELHLAVESWIDAALSSPGAFFRATVPWNFSPKFIRDHPQLIADAEQRYELLDLPAVIRLCEAFLEVDFTAQLKQIKAPACILVGERDILKGEYYARILAHELPQASLHFLPESGHASCWEAAGDFNQAILDFLAAQTD